mmetsp:Transcript_8851/g.28332  ORF Transcript_8851/g.28332 Transcript_8851/m.28332 type:complete len:293 (-) Transcript_8851:538-1416(-)
MRGCCRHHWWKGQLRLASMLRSVHVVNTLLCGILLLNADHEEEHGEVVRNSTGEHKAVPNRVSNGMMHFLHNEEQHANRVERPANHEEVNCILADVLDRVVPHEGHHPTHAQVERELDRNLEWDGKALIEEAEDDPEEREEPLRNSKGVAKRVVLQADKAERGVGAGDEEIDSSMIQKAEDERGGLVHESGVQSCRCHKEQNEADTVCEARIIRAPTLVRGTSVVHEHPAPSDRKERTHSMGECVEELLKDIVSFVVKLKFGAALAVAFTHRFADRVDSGETELVVGDVEQS